MMKADFVKFQAYQPPSEGFLSSIDFVDQLDLDGNGVGEVFATQGGFDGYATRFLRKSEDGGGRSSILSAMRVKPASYHSSLAMYFKTCLYRSDEGESHHPCKWECGDSAPSTFC